MLQNEVRVSTVRWEGVVDYRHLALICENLLFRSVIRAKMLGLGYSDLEFSSIAAVNPEIGALIVELGIRAIREGAEYRGHIHVKMDGLEISFP